MKASTVLLCVALVLLFGACGEKAKEMDQAIENAKAIANSAETMQQNAGELEKRREARRASGDTLAMPYADLQKWLPTSLNGYTAEKPEGETVNVSGMSFSSARVEFKKGDNESVDVQILDYNQSLGLYEGATTLWASGMSVDNSTETWKTFDCGFPLSAAVEHYYKNEHTAELTYALGGRFLVTITATNQQSVDGVKEIAKGIKLSELASK